MARALTDRPETEASARWDFSYERPNDPWECQLQCMQCSADVNEFGAVRQCRRKTCYTLPFCWQHLKSRAHLRVGRTRLVDPATQRRFTFRGLFACGKGNEVVFEKDDLIVSYIGEVLNQNELDNRYVGADETAPYTEDVDDDVYVDAACMRGVASLANDARPGSTCVGDTCKTNAKFVSEGGNYPFLKAIRRIRNGHEIFVEYGDFYWGGDQAPHSTNPESVYNRLEYKC